MSDAAGCKSDEPNLERLSPEDLLAYVEAAIDRLPTERLGEVISYIQDKQRSRQDEERNRLLEEWREKAASLGFQVRLEPIGTTSGRGRKRGGPGRTVAPKYRGPNGETWSGRGIPPKWLTALEATGRNREEFRIPERDALLGEE